MKAIIFGCLVAVFASCTKPTFEVHIPAVDFTEVYSWGSGFTITPDSGNTVHAEITANGITSPYSAVALNTTFTKNVYSPDSSLITVSSYDYAVSTTIEFRIANISSTGTYSIGNAGSDRKAVSAYCAIGSSVYTSDSTVLSGSVTIDTLTASRIHGVFNITCGNESPTVEIRNGSFAGNF